MMILQSRVLFCNTDYAESFTSQAAVIQQFYLLVSFTVHNESNRT
jgi:hypothetical protein